MLAGGGVLRPESLTLVQEFDTSVTPHSDAIDSHRFIKLESEGVVDWARRHTILHRVGRGIDSPQFQWVDPPVASPAINRQGVTVQGVTVTVY
jgi:hypothetical protein